VGGTPHGLKKGLKMADINAKRQQFEDRLNQVADSRQLTADSRKLMADNADQLQSWEANLDDRLDEFQRSLCDALAPFEKKKTTKTVEATPKEKLQKPNVFVSRRHRFSRDEATLMEWCQDADNMFLRELEWEQHPLPAGFSGGYQIIDTEEAMKAEIAQACGLDAVPTNVHWKEYQLGVFHVPGRGTLINPEHYTARYGVNGVTNQNHEALAKVVSDVVMERWGWGFLLEYTTLGKLAGETGMWPAMLANRARLPNPDQRQFELAEAISRKWILVKTGWMDWVWQYVNFKAHRPIGRLLDPTRPSRMFELLMRLQNLFPLRIYPFGVKISVRGLVDLVKYMFLEQGDIAPNVSQWAIRQFQDLCWQHDLKVRELVNIPLSRILGRLYFSWLENQVGILATPYAALIAAHEPQVDLATFTAQQYHEYADQSPRHNPDARLAMLSKLDARVKYDPRAMYTAAWERLKLEGPRKYFV
jgi:hypothetical protein